MSIRHELLELARDCDECALEARQINNESRPSGEERAWTAMARRIRHIAKRAPQNVDGDSLMRNEMKPFHKRVADEWRVLVGRLEAIDPLSLASAEVLFMFENELNSEEFEFALPPSVAPGETVTLNFADRTVSRASEEQSR